MKEGHGHPIYCVAFSRHLHASGGRSSAVLDDCDDDGHDGCDTASSSAIFATCGGPYATIYEIKTNQKCASSSSSSSNGELSARQVYRDVDGGEIFYTCAFGGRGSRAGVPLMVSGVTTMTTANATMKSNGIVNFGTEQQQQQHQKQYYNQRRSMKRQRRNMDNSMNDGPPLLCLGGTRGIIKIIDTNERAIHMTLYGHGNDVTDLKFSPMDDFLLLSASKDESIRLWNIQSQQRYGGGGGGVNLAIFAGHVGHRGQVLSIAWHDSGKQFVSGGMDNMIKLWNIGDMITTKTIIDNSCSDRNKNNNNATTTATTTTSNTTDDENDRRGGIAVKMALCKSQSVIPSNWSNDMGKSNSSSCSNSERIPSTTQQRQQSRQERNDRTTFDTVFQQFPYFSTNKAHTNYVGKLLQTVLKNLSLCVTYSILITSLSSFSHQKYHCHFYLYIIYRLCSIYW